MIKIKLLLADDHLLIREGFKSILGKNDRFEIVGEANNGLELLEVAHNTDPDVILTDIAMPLMSGIMAMEQLIKEGSIAKFIILTMHDEPGYVLNALKLGAHGYLLKDIERVELENAIISIYKGGKYFSPLITTIMAESFQRPQAEDYEEITPREKEVLQLVASGNSTKLIADKLNISVRTVESHRINMLKKMKVNNSSELVKKATQMNIL